MLKNRVLDASPASRQSISDQGRRIRNLSRFRPETCIKVNDGIYYASWTEYFNSIVIHNLLFPDTTYELLGFTSNKTEAFCAVLRQPFIEGGQAELEYIKEHLTFNDFQNTRRQDYFNEEFGLLLEDITTKT